MLGDTQRRLISVIFARQISTNDLCHTRRRHFYWQMRCGFRPVRGTQRYIGTLIVNHLNNRISITYPLEATTVTNEPNAEMKL